MNRDDETVVDLAIGRIGRGWRQGTLGSWYRPSGTVCLLGGLAYGWAEVHHPEVKKGLASKAVEPSPLWKDLTRWFLIRHSTYPIYYNDKPDHTAEDVVLELKKFREFTAAGGDLNDQEAVKTA